MRGCLVFVDESGDLGFGIGASRHITVAAVIVEDGKQLERIPQKMRRRRLKKCLLEKPELKFHNSDHGLRTAVLKKVAGLPEARIACVTVDKTNAKDAHKRDREEVYASASCELVHEIARFVRARERLMIVLDARPCNRDLGMAFDARVRAQAIDGCREAGRVPPEITIRRLDSRNSGGLQVADYVAGAIQRKHEIGDDRYYEIIAHLVAIERRFHL